VSAYTVSALKNRWWGWEQLQNRYGPDIVPASFFQAGQQGLHAPQQLGSGPILRPTPRWPSIRPLNSSPAPMYCPPPSPVMTSMPPSSLLVSVSLGSLLNFVLLLCPMLEVPWSYFCCAPAFMLPSLLVSVQLYLPKCCFYGPFSAVIIAVA
jgi:hypothetical protein